MKITQCIGSLLILISFVLAILDCCWFAIGTLIVVGIIDLWLIYVKKEQSISEWIRGLTKWRIDRIILIGLIPLCWWLCGSKIALWFTLGVLNAHFFNIDK